MPKQNSKPKKKQKKPDTESKIEPVEVKLVKVKIHTPFINKGVRYYGECEISEILANYVVKTGKGKIIGNS